MSQNLEKKMIPRRLVNAYLSTVVSIGLVLFLVGMAALLMMSARGVADYLKENLQISVLMKQEVSDEEAIAYKNELDSKAFILSSNFVSKAQGSQEMSDMLGADFLDVFEVSPIPASIDITLKAEYVSSDSLEKVSSIIMESPLVDELNYQQSLIEALNQNLARIAMFFGIFIILLLFISFALINNTVRLSVFSRRFTIHTMKLVGATRAFIRKPFLKHAVIQGLASSCLALILLAGLLYFLMKELSQLYAVFSPKLLLSVAGIVIASGVAICVASSWLVVNKLVSQGKDDLYY